MVMWGIVTTWHRSSSINFYILIFFFETIEPIWTKFCRNVHWMFLLRTFYFVDRKYTKETRGPKGYKKKRVLSVFVCMWRIYFSTNLFFSFFYILIFFSVITGPIGLKFDLLKVLCFFFIIRSAQKKQEAQRCQKECCLFLILISENYGRTKRLSLMD